MKKIILVLLTTIAFSCSKSDSVSTPVENKIVGSWKVVSATVQEGTTGTPKNDMETCDSQTTYVFTANSPGSKNGVLKYNPYSYSSELSNCISNGQEQTNWQDLGTNTYNFGIESLQIEFINNSNTFIMTSYDNIYIFKKTFSRQ